MELDQIIERWQSYDHRLQDVLMLHWENSLEITRMKMRSMLHSMRPTKIFAIIVGILWVIIVDSWLVAMYQQASLFFLVSMFLQSIITKIAIGLYLYQLIKVHQLDLASPVAGTQYELGKLANSTLLATRILFLQLPLWTTFFLSGRMFEHAGIFMIVLQCVFTFSFAAAAWWLFRNIRWENRNKRWFKLLLAGKEWTPLLQSIELSHEIESLEQMDRATLINGDEKY